MPHESSDDDVPLAKTNGHRLSAPIITAANDKALNTSISNGPRVPPGISIQNGPIVDDAREVDEATTNGNSVAVKRKSRSSVTQPIRGQANSDSDDEAPLAKRVKKGTTPNSDDEPITRRRGGRLPPSYMETSVLESSDDDKPLGLRLAQTKANIEADAAKEAKKIRASRAPKQTVKKSVKDESNSDVAPVNKRRRSTTNGASSAKSNAIKTPDSESDEPIAKKAKTISPAKSVAKGKTSRGAVSKAPAKAPAKSSAAPKKKGGPAKTEVTKVKSEEPEEEDDENSEFEWWNEAPKDDDTIKWTSLEHNGVIFPPEYEPLPKNVKLLYDGKPVELSIEAEEVAYFFGSMLHSAQNVENPVFQKNFFADFREVLKKIGSATDTRGNKVDIKEFSKLDFKPIFEHFQAKSEARKARSAAEKKAEKSERDKREEPFMYCKWDGRKEKVGNFRVEPPGLFRGRGEHPKTGKVKQRVQPEQITINIGKDAKVPNPPAGHKWKAVQHDNKATWLAMWQENINGNYKYVMLAANSAVKGQADFKKFEKARALKEHIDKIRADYTKELKSEIMAERQRATAIYLIDKLALRAGNEKDTENEAETVGCCSLKYEHLTLREPNTVIFDFLGKDSIRYHDEVAVDRQVFKNLKMFKKPPKTDGDDIFDRLNTAQLNKYLQTYMKGLTAKVFRTYNASYTMSSLLQRLETKKGVSMAEKIKLYNDCNREVAILCNHKRTVGAGHSSQMEKMGDRIKAAMYQKWRLKVMMLDLDPKMKKKKGAEYFQRDAELTNEWVASHQKFLVEEKRAAITKKFEKDNERLVAEGSKRLPEKELKERLKVASELEAKFKQENKSKKVLAEGKSPSIEKLEAAIKAQDGRIQNLLLTKADKEDNKDIALGTSKINYIDPRLTVVFCKKFDVPIEKFFSKTLRDKFNWAIKSVGDDSTWEF